MALLRCLRSVGGVVCCKTLLEVADDTGRFGDGTRYRRVPLGLVESSFRLVECWLDAAILVEQLLSSQGGACSKGRKEDRGHELFHFCAFLRSCECERGVVIAWRGINARK
ncbi:MAG: hypothetical protein RLZZ480_264 [Candidatus Parcubacteria bacterium]